MSPLVAAASFALPSPQEAATGTYVRVGGLDLDSTSTCSFALRRGEKWQSIVIVFLLLLYNMRDAMML